MNTSIRKNGVEAGADGFVAAVNNDTPGKLIISGFEANGTGMGRYLHFLTIHWKAVQTGTFELDLTVKDMVDVNGYSTSYAMDIDGSVTMIDKISGDVNHDGAVTIVDAHFVAQHYIGYQDFIPLLIIYYYQ